MSFQLTELSPLSSVSYLPNFLEPEEAKILFDKLQTEVKWEQRNVEVYGKTFKSPRLIGWGGEKQYRYSNSTLDVRSLPECTNELFDKLKNHCPALTFNHILFNLYRDEKDSIGFHSDNEPELGLDPTIASVSLGGTRNFIMKTKYGKKKEFEFDLTSGSLLVMHGKCQTEFLHGIPKQTEQAEPRINLTFRLLLSNPKE